MDFEIEELEEVTPKHPISCYIDGIYVGPGFAFFG